MNTFRLAVAIVLLALFAAHADHFARSTSQTFDEGVHLVAGVSYWRTGDFRLNPEHPPLLKLLWAIPVALRPDVPFDPDPEAWDKKLHWIVADQFLYEGPVPHDELLLDARRVNIVLGVLLVALIGWWAYRLWGPNSGLLAVALAACDPNLAAFAALLSMDLGLALFTMAAAYCCWEYVANGSLRWFILAGVAFGLALAAKFTALVAIAGIGLGALGYVLAGGSFAVPQLPPTTTLKSRLAALPTAFVRLGLIAVAVVIVCYFGLHAVDWARGLKQQMVRDQFGDPRFFLDGDVSRTGWFTYFIHVLAIKTPAGMLALAIISAMGFFLPLPASGRGLGGGVNGERPRRPLPPNPPLRNGEGGTDQAARIGAFLFAPAFVYFLAMSLTRIDIGWRVILPAYPAIILLASRTVTLFPKAGAGRVVGWTLVIGSFLPAVWDVRHLGEELSYANGISVGRNDLHDHLGDSNIDWGQGLKALNAELSKRGNPTILFSYAGTARPEAYGIRYERLPGWGAVREDPNHLANMGKPLPAEPGGPLLFAISVSNLQGTYLDERRRYHLFLSREPISRTDGSIWLFDITGDHETIDTLSGYIRWRVPSSIGLKP